MKKFARFLCFALVAVMLCATLASCGGPAKDPKEAAAALKENGYTVAVETDALVTAGKDGEHITINYCSDEEAATKIYDELKKSQEEAQAKLDEAEKELKEAKEELEGMEDGIEKGLKEAAVKILEEGVAAAQKLANVEIGQSGNMVWVGTAQAIKDAK